MANPDLELRGKEEGGGYCFLPFVISSFLPKIRARQGGGGERLSHRLATAIANLLLTKKPIAPNKG